MRLIAILILIAALAAPIAAHAQEVIVVEKPGCCQIRPEWVVVGGVLLLGWLLAHERPVAYAQPPAYAYPPAPGPMPYYYWRPWY